MSISRLTGLDVSLILTLFSHIFRQRNYQWRIKRSICIQLSFGVHGNAQHMKMHTMQLMATIDLTTYCRIELAARSHGVDNFIFCCSLYISHRNIVAFVDFIKRTQQIACTMQISDDKHLEHISIHSPIGLYSTSTTKLVS